MHILTCPLPLFRSVLRRLAANPDAPVRLSVGTSCVGARFEWLARRIDVHERPDADQQPMFLVNLRTSLEQRDPWRAGVDWPAHVAGRLTLTVSSSTTSVSGDVRTPGGPCPLDRVVLVGAGMWQLPCVGTQPHRLDTYAGDNARPDLGPSRRHWQRTIGALGGEDIWRRLVELRIGVVGCGRTGSLVAAQFAQLGVRDLVLIDGDCLEPHNLGEMIGVRQVGEPKVTAVARYLRQVIAEHGEITPIVRSIRDREAIAAAKTREVLVCAVDNDVGRLMATFVAAFHHKVLIDIGTGVFDGAVEGQRLQMAVAQRGSASAAAAGDGPFDRVMGADVRIVLPADGCLRCRGGLADYENAMRELCGLPPPAVPASRAGRERAGSLLTLNAMATSIGIQMLQDLVADRLQETTWARLEYDQVGHLSIRYPIESWTNDEPCALCARAGVGDLGI